MVATVVPSGLEVARSDCLVPPKMTPQPANHGDAATTHTTAAMRTFCTLIADSPLDPKDLTRE
jgi:hypothetical protein